MAGVTEEMLVKVQTCKQWLDKSWKSNHTSQVSQSTCYTRNFKDAKRLDLSLLTTKKPIIKRHDKSVIEH